jgi:hypothetical protein
MVAAVPTPAGKTPSKKGKALTVRYWEAVLLFL